jgi:hypothetical protein
MMKINIFPLILMTFASFLMLLVSSIEMFFTLLIPCVIFIAFYCCHTYKFYNINAQSGIHLNELSI